MSASLAMPHSSARAPARMHFARGASTSRCRDWHYRHASVHWAWLPKRTTARACALHERSRSHLRLGTVVGTGRFELPTCRLGGDRSIHLSYVPTICYLHFTAGLYRRATSTREG